MLNRRIVVTGMGVVSPLGCGVETVWQRLLAGQSGLRQLPEATVAELPGRVGGPVPSLVDDPQGGFDADAAVTPKDQKKMDRFILFAMAAARDALVQAGWAPQDEAGRQRTATVIGSGIGGFGAIAEAVRTTDSRGPRRLSPFTIPSFLVNLAAGNVSIQHGFKGPMGAPVTACAAGVQAIGDAARMIRAGEADIALCGGTEAAIDRVSLAGFAAARALSSGYNDTPQRASRPFDQGRDGFVMGEGAGLLVIESLDHALARGAVPIAELVGYGTSADAYHLTAGPEDGSGARRAMEQALAQAGSMPGRSPISMPMPRRRRWATRANWQPYTACSGATPRSPLRRQSQRRGTCWVRRAGWRRSLPYWHYETRSRPPRLISKCRTRRWARWISSVARLGQWRWSTP